MNRFLILFAVWLAAYSPAFGAPTLRDPNLSVTEVASGFSAPTTMAFIGTDVPARFLRGLDLIGETIAGTLEVVKGSLFKLQVTDVHGASTTRRFKILAVGAFHIVNRSLPVGRVGRTTKLACTAARV